MIVSRSCEARVYSGGKSGERGRDTRRYDARRERAAVGAAEGPRDRR